MPESRASRIRRAARPTRWGGTLLAAAMLVVGSSAGAMVATGPQSEAPPRFDVDQEFAQGVVRDVSERDRTLLIEVRDDADMLRASDRLQQLDLRRATGWVFIDDPEGGPPEVGPLDEMFERFRVGQIVEIGARYGPDSRAVLADSIGRPDAARPDPRDPRVRGGDELGLGRVDTIRIEGPIQVRVSRAYE